MQKRLIAVSVVAILSLAVFSGCSSSGSSGKSKSTTTTTAGKNYQVTTSQGQVSLSLDGKLPPNWPSGFPVPQGAEAAGSGSLVGKSSGTMVAVYTLSGSAQDAFNFYKTNGALTVTDSSSVGGNKAFAGTVSFKGTYNGSVWIGAISSGNGVVAILDTGASSSTTSASSSTSTG